MAVVRGGCGKRRGWKGRRGAGGVGRGGRGGESGERRGRGGRGWGKGVLRRMGSSVARH